jgi:hypothetical protein
MNREELSVSSDHYDLCHICSSFRFVMTFSIRSHFTGFLIPQSGPFL